MNGQGMLIAVEGPGGVGKSTVTAALTTLLRDEFAVNVCATREPTDTPLGTMARQGTDVYRGLAMAHLIAADRYQHLDEQIRPAMARGEIVVCDRYIASSLVLQVMDGVDRETVWRMNEAAERPDLVVLLTAHPDVLTNRLARRGTHSRFERETDSSHIEYGLFAEAAKFLADRDVPIVELDATAADPDTLARIIAGDVLTMRSHKSHAPGRADLQPQQPVPGASGEATLVPDRPAGAGPRTDRDGA
ncbi:dTMP kinase [Streptomyces cylindrosporus]|uniref:Thymidylate kinase n=1 Tax=Streptomyces cylindrosporus TaxID=2927583 RepID=A0ABS9YK86_9ACTN|nr:dTMP kinase [Streptomyces cylindrosporus]MCI3277671.1 dTMP kinase [Streptomyces cylindrosporus]